MTYVKYVTPQNVQKAIRYGKLAYNIGKKMYSTYQSLKPRTTTTTRPFVRTVAKPKYRAIVKPISTYRKRKYVQKIKSLNRKVGPVFKKSIYNKKTSKIRRNNTGKLSLQNRIQNGLSLPNVTFARLQWRGSISATTLCRNPLYAGTLTTTALTSRTFCLNDISSPPSLSNKLNHNVNYYTLWKSLYQENKVLGSTAIFKITPTSLPTYQVTTESPRETDSFSYQLPLGVKNGFWYARVFYYRAGVRDVINEPNAVGHHIDEGPLGALSDDPGTEQLWSSMREFLTDPTVTFKKDTSYVRQKMHVHTENPLDSELTGNNSFPGTNSTTSYEIEMSTKPVTLKVNFSAKKNFQDTNPMRNLPWIPWDHSLGSDFRFLVRIGYVAFKEDDSIAYHIPLSRNPSFILETDIKYFVAMRNPKIQPSSQDSELSNMKLNLPEDLGDLDYADDEVNDEIQEEVELPQLFE